MPKKYSNNNPDITNSQSVPPPHEPVSFTVKNE